LEEERLKAILESLLFAAAEPVALAQLVTVLETVARDDVKRALSEMATAYGAGGRGIVLEEVAGGYQLRTPKEHALYVRKLLAAKPPRLSRPLLETVAIVAYRQPITRPEIEQLRGVDCGGVLDTLVERRLVKIAGRKEAPGRPIMYETTTEFLELFGLRDLSGLPDLEELRLIETPREVPLFAREDGADTAEPYEGLVTAQDSVDVEDVAASKVVEVSEGSEIIEDSIDHDPTETEIAADPPPPEITETARTAPDIDSTADDSAAANDAAIEASQSAHDGEAAHGDKTSASVPDDRPADEDSVSPSAKPEDHD
jgi:segregation and condensation protein B